MKMHQRMEKIRLLVDAINDCHDDDALMVMAVIMEGRSAGAPGVAFDAIDREAENCAALATFDEARAFFLACGRRLADFPLGPKGRVRMAVRSLEGLPSEDRAEVLQAIAAYLARGLRSVA